MIAHAALLAALVAGEDALADDLDKKDPDAPKGGKLRELFVDPEDHAFDMSGVLSSPGGFLPFAVPITEPAIGYGAFLGMMFLTRGPNPRPDDPPSISMVGGAVTSELTWAAAAAHLGYWAHDHVRYIGAVGYGDVGLTYYGTVNPLPVPLDFDLEAPFTLQQFAFRLGPSEFFLGLRYRFSWVRVKFDDPGEAPVDEDELQSRLGGFAVVTTLDTRDNLFTPNRGMLIQVVGNWDAPWFGSSFNFGSFEGTWVSYQEPMKRLVLGLRTIASTSFGDVPFYAQPFVQLRGVPIFRYVGSWVLSAEGEMRWDFWRRWSLVPFGGVGAAISDRTISGGSVAWGAGLGFRYLIAREYGMRVGIDVARGPEQFAVYVIVGSSWFNP